MLQHLDKAHGARSESARSETFVSLRGYIVRYRNLTRLDWRHQRAQDKWLDDEIINLMSQRFFLRAIQLQKKVISRQRKFTKRYAVSHASRSTGGAAAIAEPREGAGVVTDSTVAGPGAGAASSKPGQEAVIVTVGEGVRAKAAGGGVAGSAEAGIVEGIRPVLYHQRTEELPEASKLEIRPSSCGLVQADDDDPDVVDSGGVRFLSSQFFTLLFRDGAESSRR